MAFTTLIDPAALHAHLQDPDWVVVDCRFDLKDPEAGFRAYARGHIPGACYAHLDRDLAGPVTPRSGRHPLPDPQTLVQTLCRWGIGEGVQVVVYDDMGGAFAARLWWLLRWIGHHRAAVLNGGLAAWTRAQLPLSTEPPAGRGTESCPVARPDTLAWVETAYVAANAAGGDNVLVDARAPARFRGEQEPIDPVAGHVPGAVNRPHGDNLDAGGRFLSPELLRARFAPLVGERPAACVLHMCGSGVTACHNLLAMEVAGLPGSRLYVGSWSEWTRDPARPVAREEA